MLATRLKNTAISYWWEPGIPLLRYYRPKMNWISIFTRVMGTFSPLSAALVQLQSEMDSAALTERVTQIEEPLRALHPDFPEVGLVIYDALKAANDSSFKIADTIYGKYRRCFALLEQQQYLKSAHRIGNSTPLSVYISDASFLLYLCALFEDRSKMDALFTQVDTAPRNSVLDGRAIAQDLDLPIPVVRAIFEAFAAKGLGYCSKENGRVAYRSHA